MLILFFVWGSVMTAHQEGFTSFYAQVLAQQYLRSERRAQSLWRNRELHHDRRWNRLFENEAVKERAQCTKGNQDKSGDDS
jgi:hypothetical protein